MAATEMGLRRRERLARGLEFDRVFRGGVRLDGRLFVLLAARNRQARHRLGLTVGKRLGKAARRNRAKRLLRESFRRLRIESAAGFDVVLVAKKEIVGQSQAEVDREYRERLRRLLARSGSAGVAGPD